MCIFGGLRFKLKTQFKVFTDSTYFKELGLWAHEYSSNSAKILAVPFES